MFLSIHEKQLNYFFKKKTETIEKYESRECLKKKLHEKTHTLEENLLNIQCFKA